MNREEVITKFKEKKYLITMGAGSISKMFDIDIDVVREIKAMTRSNLKRFGTTYHPKEVAFKPEVTNKQRILIIDVESAPMKSFV